MADTIAAPITAPGQAGVSLVRVSGEQTKKLLQELLPKADAVLAQPRSLIYTPIRDLSGKGGEDATLDIGLVAFFQGPNSYTGEDSAEFHLHGSPYLVARFLEGLSERGIRLARPGEFSERAFHNGKMDLAQAEAVCDLISSETEAQARVAREQLEGKLSHAISDLGEPLRGLLAEIEAHIDFPEEDIDPLSREGWKKEAQTVAGTLEKYLSSYSTGRLYREGASVALVGLPNAGKSSLLNRILGEDRVIVTAVAGTTRDTIEERISLKGLCVRLWDTAGLLETSRRETEPDEVELLGIERSWAQLEKADLVVYVIDGTADIGVEKAHFEEVQRRAKQVVTVVNKSDLFAGQESEVTNAVSELLTNDANTPLLISASSGDGVETLLEDLYSKLLSDSSQQQSLLVCSERHRNCLQKAAEENQLSIQAISDDLSPEYIALHLRSTLGALDDIVGVTHTEDILGLIFSKFCIGK